MSEYVIINHNNKLQSQVVRSSKYLGPILKKVSKNLSRNLNKDEIAKSIEFLEGMPSEYFLHNYKKKPFNQLVEKNLTKIITTHKHEEDIDIKELLIQEIGQVAEASNSNDIYDRIQQKANVVSAETPKKNFLGVSNITDFIKIVNPAAATKTQYLILDSRFKNEESSNSQKLVWDYAAEKANTTGTFSLAGSVRDIVSFKIFPFKLPYTADADTKRQLLTLFIEELNTQAFIGHQNRRFNFVLYTTINAEFIEIKPVQENQGEFKLHKVLTKLDSISITIGDPNKLITFTRDRDLITIDYFGSAPLTVITTDNPHNLSNGDIIIINNFTYGYIDPVLIEQITQNNLLAAKINSEDGYEATVISPTQFSITLDTSSIMAPLPATTKFNVFYDSKRVYIPMQIEYINPIE